MEFNFRLSDLFPTEISIVGNSMIPNGSPGVAKIGAQIVKERLSEIMDVVGKASAVAQSLQQVITTAAKLRDSDGDHQVYFLCDFAANQVVGLLKIGKKKLFVYDQQGVQHELSPLCILDFYIHESRQRIGCGKVLFDAMLQNEQVDVRHFAIDRPSDKLVFFLRKHYQLTKIIPQVNNFVIFDGFFHQRPDYAGKKPRWGGLDQTPERPSRHGLVNKTEFQDSRSYNKEPALHLRNCTRNGIPGYTSARHVSQIGNVVQPLAPNGVVSSSAHALASNGLMRRFAGTQGPSPIRSHPDLKFHYDRGSH